MLDLLTQVGLPIALIFIMAGVGLSLTPNDFRRVLQEPRGFLLGAVAQLILLPLVAVAIIALFQLPPALAIGLFILALCPGGTTSNLYSYLCKADIGLSVSLTAVIGFITPVTIPLMAAWAIHFYGAGDASLQLPIVSTWLKLMIITVFPVLLGMAIRAKWTDFATRAEPVISKLSILVLVLVILSIVAELGSELLRYTLLVGPAALLLNLVTMALGYGLGRWLLHRDNQARTICLEVGLQNGTLALLITTGMLKSAEMSIAPSVYSMLMFVTASLFTVLVLRHDRRILAAHGLNSDVSDRKTK